MSLVVARKTGQRLVIGGNVWITVTHVSPGRIELAVDAPREIAVDREEIHLRKHPNASVPEQRR